MSLSMGIRNRRSLLMLDLTDTHSIGLATSPPTKKHSTVRRLAPAGIGEMVSSLPISSTIIQTCIVAARIPFVRADSFGNEITNNLISDIAPLLALFGERVAQQFMSQSMGIADNIIFAVAPLGIVTAMVGAIRVGGPRVLRSIIGRARERRADVEIELMSSTSGDVCEIWDGSAVVRAVGQSPIVELIYVMPRALLGSENTPLLMKWEDDIGIYDFEAAKRLPRSSALLQHKWSSHATIPDHHHRDPVSAPNISLNMAKMGSQLELCSVAVFGVVLQSSVIVYAVIINYLPLLGSKLQKTGYRATIYTPLLACGTVVLVVGMYLCSYIVERSTVEESWEIKKVGGATVQVVWLQKGGVVGDQIFNAYALSPAISKAIWRQPGTKRPVRKAKGIMHARWNMVVVTCRFLWPLVCGVPIRLIGYHAGKHFGTPFAWITNAFKLLWTSFSRGGSRACLRTSRQDSSGDQQILTGISVVFSLTGFVGQFMGLRGLHWSVTVLQLGATVLMTILRSWVRRNLIHDPVGHKITNGYELDWMAKNIKHCKEWRVVTWGVDVPLPPNDVLAANVLAARRRLGALTNWPSQWQITVNSTVEAIASSMNFLFSSPEFSMIDENDWLVRDRFEWIMMVEVEGGAGEGPGLGEIELSLTRCKLADGPWGPWKVARSEVEAVLGLWMLHFHNMDMPNQPNVVADELISNWRHEEHAPTSSKPILRVLSIYDELNRMDYERWILRQSHPVKIDSLDEHKRYNHIIGNPTRCNITPGSPVLGVITETSLAKVLGQSIYAAFMSKISEHVQIGGNVRIRWGNTQAKDSFGLLSPGLVGLAGIVEDTGLANTEEAYMSIVPAFSRLENLPIGTSHSALLVLIVDGANNHAREKKLDYAESFLLWLFDTAESTVAVYKARKQWRKAAETYLDLRSVCNDIDHALAADYIDDADDRISLFCETFFTMTALDSGNETDTLEAVRASVTDLLGENARLVLEKWKQANPDIVQANPQVMREVDGGSKDEQLRLAAADGDSLLIGRLLANGANIDCCQAEKGECTPLTVASRAGLAAVVENLLMHGANPTLQDYNGRTALHHAAERGHTSIVRMLLRCGEQIVNIHDNQGQTSLDLAIAKNVGAVVNLLLFNGANDASGRARKLMREMQSARDTENGLSVDIVSGRLPVHWAAWIGSSCAFGALIHKRVDIQPTDIFELTPLHIAAMNGSLPIVQIILKELGINIDAKDTTGATALHHAASSGHVAIVQLLLDRGADRSAMDVNEEMPLHVAVSGGQHEIVGLLLDVGASPDTRYRDEETLLHRASVEGHFTAAQLLLDRQSDFLARNRKNETALHQAARAGHEAIVNLLLDRGADIEAANELGERPLHQAASSGVEAVVRLLLHRGANEGATDNNQETAVHKATSSGCDATLRRLLHQPADYETIYPDGESLLHKATRAGHHGIVELLLSWRQDCEARYPGGMTLLSEAAGNGHEETVRLLLARGANTDTRDEQLRTPIHSAAMNGHTGTVELLLDHGVNINSTALDGQLALHGAAFYGHTATVQLLLERGASMEQQDVSGESPIHNAARNGHTATVALLVDHGANAGRWNFLRQQPLHLAAENGDKVTVRVLLNHGVDMDEADLTGETATHLAAGSGHTDTLVLLLEHGANADRKTVWSTTPLHLAAAHGHTATVTVLLDHGVTLNTRTVDRTVYEWLAMPRGGMTALQLARGKQHMLIVQLLLDRGAIE